MSGPYKSEFPAADGMNQKQADQLRRAINKLMTARADCDYAAAHEPHKWGKALDHLARCVRRLDALIVRLSAKEEPKG